MMMVLGKLELARSSCSKMARSHQNICDGWLCKGNDCKERSCSYGEYGLFEHLLFLFYLCF